jgi:hypothetical protein
MAGTCWAWQRPWQTPTAFHEPVLFGYSVGKFGAETRHLRGVEHSKLEIRGKKSGALSPAECRARRRAPFFSWHSSTADLPGPSPSATAENRVDRGPTAAAMTAAPGWSPWGWSAHPGGRDWQPLASRRAPGGAWARWRWDCRARQRGLAFAPARAVDSSASWRVPGAGGSPGAWAGRVGAATGVLLPVCVTPPQIGAGNPLLSRLSCHGADD